MTAPFVSSQFQQTFLPNQTSSSGLVTQTSRNQLAEAMRATPGAAITGGPLQPAPGGIENPYGRSLSAFEPNTQVYGFAGDGPIQQATGSTAAQANSGTAEVKAVSGAGQSQEAQLSNTASPGAAGEFTPPDDPAADQKAAQEAVQRLQSQVGNYSGGGIVDASGKVQQMISAALQLAANRVPYVWGGSSATGVDCSGLIYYAATAAGIPWQRYRSTDYGRMGTAVTLASARPGDIVYYDEGNGAGHVGIYLGNGKMVAAPQSGENVQVQDVYGTPTSIRRIFTDNQFSAMATPTGTTYAYGGRAYNPYVNQIGPNGQVTAPGLTTQQYIGATFGSMSDAAKHAATESGDFSPNNTPFTGFSSLFSGLTTNINAGLQQAAHPDQAWNGQPITNATLASSTPYASQFEAAATRYGVPAPLLAAVAQQESGFNPNARSSAGALGMMQFMPGTARGLGINPLDPASAIDGAARYLSGLYSQFGDWNLALAAYNAGPGAVRQYGGIPPYYETQHYVTNVNALYQRFSS